MAGLDPAIYVFASRGGARPGRVDARTKSGHDRTVGIMHYRNEPELEIVDWHRLAAMKLRADVPRSDLQASGMFPVSIKGVLYETGRVVLLENEREEWELPGGRLEPGETPEGCLAREVEEELGIATEIGPLLDCWVYEVLPEREVLIVTYGLHRRDRSPLRVSGEHRRIGLFSLDQIECIPLPRGYHRAVRAWAQLNGSE